MGVPKLMNKHLYIETPPGHYNMKRVLCYYCCYHNYNCYHCYYHNHYRHYCCYFYDYNYCYYAIIFIIVIVITIIIIFIIIINICIVICSQCRCRWERITHIKWWQPVLTFHIVGCRLHYSVIWVLICWRIWWLHIWRCCQSRDGTRS